MKFLLDTNVIIDLLKGRQGIKAGLEHLDAASPLDFAANPITLSEVLCGVRADESAVTEQFFRQISFYPLGAEESRLAAAFRKSYGPSHGVTLPDALIAGTAVRHRLTLVTQNARHFPMPELTLHILKEPG